MATKMITSTLTIDECRLVLNELNLAEEFVEVSKIPACLQPDFDTFMIGKTRTMLPDDKEAVTEGVFHEWYKKIMVYDGVDYLIQFKTD